MFVVEQQNVSYCLIYNIHLWGIFTIFTCKRNTKKYKSLYLSKGKNLYCLWMSVSVRKEMDTEENAKIFPTFVADTDTHGEVRSKRWHHCCAGEGAFWDCWTSEPVISATAAGSGDAGTSTWRQTRTEMRTPAVLSARQNLGRTPRRSQITARDRKLPV